MNELKPCPFCDGNPHVFHWPKLFNVGCKSCHAEGPACRTQEKAIAMWNRRAPQGRLTAQLRECAETLGADQIDEQRAMRAYADATKLLDELKEK